MVPKILLNSTSLNALKYVKSINPKGMKPVHTNSSIVRNMFKNAPFGDVPFNKKDFDIVVLKDETLKLDEYTNMLNKSVYVQQGGNFIAPKAVVGTIVCEGFSSVHGVKDLITTGKGKSAAKIVDNAFCLESAEHEISNVRKISQASDNSWQFVKNLSNRALAYVRDNARFIGKNVVGDAHLRDNSVLEAGFCDGFVNRTPGTTLRIYPGKRA